MKQPRSWQEDIVAKSKEKTTGSEATP